MSDTPRNVVLVSVDSLRADHCGFLGDDRGVTPTMDELAAEGVVFPTAVSPGPQTFSSMPAVFTGHHRPAGNLEAYSGETHWQRRLDAIDDHLGTYTSLPERLQRLGYSTAGFSPNPWTSTASGFDRGFDHFADLTGDHSSGWGRTVAERIPGLDESSKPVEITLNLLTGSSFFTPWESYYDQILAVREQLPEPYFLWVFVLDTHYPFLPGRTHRTEQSLYGMVTSAIRSEKTMRGRGGTLSAAVCDSMQRSYRDTVRSVDSFVDRLWTDLAEDDPVLVLHSDHGESFGEHGNYGHNHRQLYEENVHVPYLVHGGDQSIAATDPTSLATIPQVVMSMARDGDLDPATVTDSAAVSRSECGTNRAVRYRRFKYVESDRQRSLFALSKDTAEGADVTVEFPERCAASRTLLHRFEANRSEVEEISHAARTVATSRRL